MKLLRKNLYIVFILSIVVDLADAAPAAPILHELALHADPQARTVEVSDRITFPLPPAEGELSFDLAAAAKITFTDVPVQSERKTDNRFHRYTLSWPGGRKTLSMKMVLPWPTPNRDYLWLDSGHGWYPEFRNELARQHPLLRFSLSAHLPPAWHAVAQGDMTPALPAQSGPGQKGTSGGAEFRFVARQPQQGIDFVAAPFHVYHKQGRISAAAYLLQPDRELAERYLQVTESYIDLYAQMLGPYPYSSFSLVENPEQTGYGMPSFTLLGSRVIRLPFILHTSYPHEILHNWWGNSVYVDPRQGNWSEGLTAYLADHYLKERRGQAVQYRRDALQAYRDYVSTDKDFALTDFRGRHDRASQAVGYNKGLMLFHMLRRQMGDDAFFDALRRFYAQKKFQLAGFDDLRAYFEQAAGRSLEESFAQWVTRAGAPDLRLAAVGRETTSTGTELRFELQQTQPGPPYRLSVPVTVHDAQGGVLLNRTVSMYKRSQGYTVAAPDAASSLAVDPRFDVFRLLDPSEVPPSVGALLGAGQWTFVLPAKAPEKTKTAYLEFARQWGDAVSLQWDTEAVPDDGPVWLLGWNNMRLDAFRPALKGMPVAFEDGKVTIAGNTYSAASHSVLLAARPGPRPWLWLAQAAGEINAGRLRHYGKYSYVVFTAGRPVLRGQWPVRGSIMQRNFTDE